MMGAEYIDLDEAERVEARSARSSRNPYCDAYSHAETATVWPVPTPLVRPMQPPKQFPVEALGPVMGNATRGIADIVQCPLPIAGCSVLAAASLAAQAHVDVVHPAIGRRVPEPDDLGLERLMPFPDSRIVRGGHFVNSESQRLGKGQIRPTSLKTAANANENLWWRGVCNLQPMIQDQP